MDDPMYRILGNSFRSMWISIAFVAAWVIVLAVAVCCGADWRRVTVNGEVAFLPNDSPSVRADQVYKNAFPLQYSGSNIAIVIVLLLILYRAPLVALIPLSTVFVSVSIAIPLLATLAQWGWLSPSRDLRVFIIVLAYGAGVDYCLFLIARFREELDGGGG